MFDGSRRGKPLIVRKTESQAYRIRSNEILSDRTHDLLAISFAFVIGDDPSDIEERKGLLIAYHWMNRLDISASQDVFCFDQEKIQPVTHVWRGGQTNLKLAL